jgi:hypothetical protein
MVQVNLNGCFICHGPGGVFEWNGVDDFNNDGNLDVAICGGFLTIMIIGCNTIVSILVKDIHIEYDLALCCENICKNFISRIVQMFPFLLKTKMQY